MGKIVRQKWRLDRLLGMGGMAAVYAATHRNGHRVAIKMLHPWLLSIHEARARFLREAYVANSVEHPGVVPVSDDDEAEDGSPFLVMELLHGESLDDRLARLGRLSFVESLLITHDLLDVLEAAHRAFVLHRDIKPDNIFLQSRTDRSSGAQLRLLDFGVARLRELAPTDTATRQGFLLGTPAYMGPEMALGRWDLVDARSDIWAVGATLRAMLTGAHPREGEDYAVLLGAASEPLSDVRELRPDVPESIARLVEIATAMEMGDRYPDAATMRAEVERCRAQIEGSNAAISVQRLASTISDATGISAGPVSTQEFERDDLALSAIMPSELDDDATCFEPLSPEALAALRPRARSTSSGANLLAESSGAEDDEPTEFIDRIDVQDPWRSTEPDGEPSAHSVSRDTSSSGPVTLSTEVPIPLVTESARRRDEPMSISATTSNPAEPAGAPGALEGTSVPASPTEPEPSLPIDSRVLLLGVGVVGLVGAAAILAALWL